MASPQDRHRTICINNLINRLKKMGVDKDGIIIDAGGGPHGEGIEILNGLLLEACEQILSSDNPLKGVQDAILELTLTKEQEEKAMWHEKVYNTARGLGGGKRKKRKSKRKTKRKKSRKKKTARKKKSRRQSRK